MDTVSTKPTWIPIRCSIYTAMYSHTSIPFKNYIITFGGTDDSKIMNLTFALDMETYKEADINIIGMTPTKRYAHSACLWGPDRAVFFGGKPDKKAASLLNEVLILNLTSSPLSGSYKVIQPQNAENLHRMWHTANIYEDNMYVFGGKTKQQETTNELWKLDLTNLAWQRCQPTGYAPEERYSHSSVAIKEKIYYYGGYSSKQKTNLVDLFYLDTSTMIFRKLADSNVCPEPRRGMCLFQRNNNQLFVFGGKQDNNSYFNDIYSYDLSNFSTTLYNILTNQDDQLGWTQVETKNQPPATRGWPTCTPYKSGFVIWGGALGSIYYNDIFYLLFEPEENKNSQIALKNLSSQIKDMYTQKLFCDVSFEVEGQNFPAHRGILAARSRYFTNMFNSGMKESVADTISIPDCKKRTFEAFLNWIYTNEIDKTGDEDQLMIDLFELGEKWLVLDLKTKCEQFLTQNISPNNVVKIATLAEMFDNEFLTNQTITFMVKNFNDLEEKNLLEELPKSLYIKLASSLAKKTPSS